ncbi:MAG: histidine kinase dimerization/phosphoacceptor domain -containing protein, partial [Spirochaetota bacterium]
AILYSAALAVLLTAVSPRGGAQEIDRDQILILNSYHNGFEWSDRIMEGLKETLGKEHLCYIEYMDTKRFPYETQIGHVEDYFKEKYGPGFFDLIVTTDDNALRFLFEYRDELWPGVRAVFCGVNDFHPAVSRNREWITGLMEKNDHVKTIRSALMLLPSTERILAVTDNTTSGKAQLETMKTLAGSLFTGLEFEYLNDDGNVTLDRVRRTLSEAPPHTVVYFSDLHLDGNLEYLDYRNYLGDLTREYPVPFFVHSDFLLGYGTVGGMITSGYYQGTYAGRTAERILRGERTEDIPVLRESPNRYMFDARTLERFSIPERRLPEDATVLYEEGAPLKEMLGWLIPSIIGILFFAVLSLGLTVNIGRRKQAERLFARERDLFHTLLDNIPDFIFFKDRESRFTRINTALVRYLGLETPADGVGRTDADFYNEDIAAETRRDELEVMEAGRPLVNKEEKLELGDGIIRWQTTTKLPLYDEKGNIAGTFGIARDLTELKRYVDELKRSLNEKEILLKEVHHRVKNNLAMISSLINLHPKDGLPQDAVNLLEDLKGRLYSIALVHDRIYTSENFSSIDLTEYITRLVGTVVGASGGESPDTDVDIDVRDLKVSLDKAVPIALILNELITNSFKHGLSGTKIPEGCRKKLIVTGGAIDDHAVITVQDNGLGFPEGFDPNSTSSLGFQIASALTLQIEGTLTCRSEGGARCELSFPLAE